jgi:hypothetical protein
VHRGSLLLALCALGCEEPAPPPPPVPVPVVYRAAPVAWPVGITRGVIGRGQAPQLAESLPITAATALAPLHLPSVWQVPGDGPARAAVDGLEGAARAIEMIEIDAGRVTWRDAKTCGGPIVGVTASAIVCSDARGIRALTLDGKPAWQSDATFIAMTDDRIVAAGAGEAAILDATNGGELARVKLPAGVSSDSVIASCGDAGRELFAVGQDGYLAHIAEAKGGPQVTWRLLLGNVVGIDACTGPAVLVTVSTQSGTGLVAVARDTGLVTGRIDGLRGYWPARDGSDRIEISTPAGVASWPRDLATSVVPGGTPAATAAVPLELPRAEELLAKRGDRRLVRLTAATAVLLDRDGVRAYLPLAELGAAVGDTAIVAASWRTSPGETVHRLALPPAERRRIRTRTERAPLGVPAELRDLPLAAPLDTSGAVARQGVAMTGVAALALDPLDPQRLYVTTLEQPPEAPGHAGVARYDLAGKRWTWYEADGCGDGTPVGLAVTRDTVVCAARGAKATVTATSRDGGRAWQWTGDSVDGVQAGGDIVVVSSADRAVVLDARHGDLLRELASDDGLPMRAAALDIAGMTLLVTYEEGRVVARLPRVGFAPAWSFTVEGVVRTLAASGDGVLVSLENGDAYRIDARTARVVAVPGLDLAWTAAGDVVVGTAAGGPVPPEVMPRPPPPPRPRFPVPVRRRPVQEAEVELPPIATPWPPPPPMEDSWQLTLYELAGGLRARNDYALPAPVVLPAQRGPGDSSFVVAFGPGLREALVIEPRRGDPVRRVQLPEDAVPGLTFATIVDGRPVAGTILAAPLRVVTF